ncbi:MAG: rod shape-determining protein MreD [Gemmatimonadales bacterium]|nr:rod shape-determining protein MreD [Gemmatimonadales bacterium]MBA3555981.1 rod shape-determining protein MreD [Gemmatimonadales bacterium]
MSASRANRIQLILVMALLVVLHFYLRPRLWSARVSPDFLLMGLVFFAMRAGPGAGALAGFAVGIVNDALTPAAFGAGALAHTVVGYLAAWGRAVFFADNLLVNAAFVAVALWVRDVILLLASGTAQGRLLVELTLNSPLQAISTAVFALLVLAAFREWFAIRLDV